MRNRIILDSGRNSRGSRRNRRRRYRKRVVYVQENCGHGRNRCVSLDFTPRHHSQAGQRPAGRVLGSSVLTFIAWLARSLVRPSVGESVAARLGHHLSIE